MEMIFYLTCTKEEAFNELKKHIDGPLSPAFLGNNYRGSIFESEDTFSIWSKLERIGGRTAVAEGRILQHIEGSIVEATIDTWFIFPFVSTSSKFYWKVIPATILLTIIDIYLMIIDKHLILLYITSILTILGVVSMYLGFMKMIGIDNQKLLEKELRSIFQKHKKDSNQSFKNVRCALSDAVIGAA